MGIYAKMFQVYYTSRNLLSRFISFAITPAKLKGGGFLHHSPLSPIALAWDLSGAHPRGTEPPPLGPEKRTTRASATCLDGTGCYRVLGTDYIMCR